MDLSQINFALEEGTIMQHSVDDKYYAWKDGSWHEVKMEGANLELNLYDMNKQIIAQLPDLTDWDKIEVLLNDFYNIHHNTYYMMYGKEISYFTLFKVNEPLMFGEIVIECFPGIGTVKAVDITDTNDAVEIWVLHNNEPTCLYLFPYDMGLVEVGE